MSSRNKKKYIHTQVTHRHHQQQRQITLLLSRLDPAPGGLENLDAGAAASAAAAAAEASGLLLSLLSSIGLETLAAEAAAAAAASGL